MLRKIKMEDSYLNIDENNKTKFPTYVQSVLTTAEPYLTNDVSLMSTDNLVDVLVGYTHSDSSERLPIANVVEQRLTQIALGNTMDFEEFASALYKLGTNQTGSKLMINKMFHNFTQNVKKFKKNYERTDGSSAQFIAKYGILIRQCIISLHVIRPENQFYNQTMLNLASMYDDILKAKPSFGSH